MRLVPFCGMISARAFGAIMNKPRLFIALIALCFAAATVVNAQEWTQWRGLERDGSTKNAPATWPQSLQRTWR
jgi:hypothetical protein